jgi:DNA adenine methylase
VVVADLGVEQLPDGSVPFLKWAGGKNKLLPQLRPYLPPAQDFESQLNRYIEPFLGGGALFFDTEPRRALLNDKNAELITTYLAVQGCVDELIAELRRISEVEDDTELRYYLHRERYNRSRGMSLVERAALFIYLNKTCFNGLYRVNKDGRFNTPAGDKLNFEPDTENLYRASRALTCAELHSNDFAMFLIDIDPQPGDFVYFDPPYQPVSKSAAFTAYTEAGFDLEEQERLYATCCWLDDKKVSWALSNSDTEHLRTLYSKFKIIEVEAPRAIAAQGDRRRPVTELLIRNFLVNGR